MKISVCFAVPMEAVAFRRLLKGRTEEVRIFFTGIGQESARGRTETHLAQERPDFLICAGFAGGLMAGLEIGEVVVGGNVSSRDLAMTGCRRGKIHTAQEVISSVENREALAAESDALAVDMESSAVFKVAEDAGVPVATIRSISDVPGRPVPVPLAVSYDLRRQCARPLDLLVWLLAHPASIGPFLVFLHDLRKARESLAVALLQAVEHLLSEERGSAL